MCRDKALATGSEFLGEGVLFGIAVLATGWEYKVSNDKASVAKREQAEREVTKDLKFLPSIFRHPLLISPSGVPLADFASLDSKRSRSA